MTLRSGTSTDTGVSQVQAALRGRRDVTLGGGDVAGKQVGEQALVDLGFAEALAFPLLAILAGFIFQHGRLTGPLAYTSQRGIEETDFLILVTVVFALSTDYGVFLLSRIKEARDQGAGDREAVAIGLERTGPLVTAASLMLAVAIGAFATAKVVFLKEVGVGTACAVLIDAFIIRTLLVPALMALLGRRNWWSPTPLTRLHSRLPLGDAQGP